MRIAFFADGPKSGLANNGGSRTIVRSAAALRELGHKVDIVARYDKYTWDEHPKCRKEVPNADVIVAVSCKDVKDAKKTGLPLVWWVRGIELWAMPEDKLIERARMCDLVICNADHLTRWLQSYYVDAKLCYAGLDFDFWKDYGDKRDKVGGLLIERHNAATKRGDIVKSLCNRFATGNLTQEQMRDLYNECKIWVSCSESEGFHQCAAEAALCGCVVVGTNNPRGGTRDWLDDTTGYLYSTVEEARDIIQNMDGHLEKVHYAKTTLLRKIGSRRKNMRRFVELCQSL